MSLDAPFLEHPLPATPRVSVIIPCFNDGALIGCAIRSLAEQEAHELVIVDDGSTDEMTLQVLDALAREGVQVIHQKNAGPGPARMAGMRATAARYIVALDADDALAPGALSALADTLDRTGDDLVWGDVVAFGRIRARRARKARTLSRFRMRYQCEIGNSGACMYRRDAVEEVGGWDLEYGWEDWDLWMKMAAAGMRGTGIDRVCAYYRIHAPRVNAHWSGAQADANLARMRERHSALFSPAVDGRGEPTLIRILWPQIERLHLPWTRRQQLMMVTCLIAEPWRISRPWRGPLPD